MGLHLHKNKKWEYAQGTAKSCGRDILLPARYTRLLALQTTIAARHMDKGQAMPDLVQFKRQAGGAPPFSLLAIRCTNLTFI